MRAAGLKCLIIRCIITVFIIHSACSPATNIRSENSRLVAERKYQNPVYNHDFPDPTVIKATDGYYYAYATNTRTREGKQINIQVARSQDLVNWEALGDALPEPPVWANRDFWAPHVNYDPVTGLYYLYYSGESVNDTIGKCLGVATSTSPVGPFTDKGKPLLCGESFENIDPMLFDDPVSGKKFLYWGSAHKPLKVQELSDDRLSFKMGSTPVDVISPVLNNDPANYRRLIEGPWIVYRKPYYYLFLSGDNCCGDKAHYAVMAARAGSPKGPFVIKDELTHGVILQGKGRWIAPGHNSVVTDEAGEDWIVYHAIDSMNKRGGRIMLIDKIIYKNGWPTVERGTPSYDSVPVPVVNR